MWEPAKHEAGASDRHEKDEFMLVFCTLHVFGPWSAFQIWKLCKAFHIGCGTEHEHSYAKKSSCKKRVGWKLSREKAHSVVKMVAISGSVAFVLMCLSHRLHLKSLLKYLIVKIRIHYLYFTWLTLCAPIAPSATAEQPLTAAILWISFTLACISTSFFVFS